MVYLAINLFIFIIFSILHIWIHRFFAGRGIFTLKTTLIFILGLIISMYITTSFAFTSNMSFQAAVPPAGGSVGMTWNISIPYSGVIFYILLVCMLIIFYTTPSFSSVSPSTMILKLLRKHSALSYAKMRGYFSNETLITARLMDLQKAGLIISEKGIFKATIKGKRLAKMIDLYRKLFGWSVGG